MYFLSFVFDIIIFCNDKSNNDIIKPLKKGIINTNRDNNIFSPLNFLLILI